MARGRKRKKRAIGRFLNFFSSLIFAAELVRSTIHDRRRWSIAVVTAQRNVRGVEEANLGNFERERDAGVI